MSRSTRRRLATATLASLATLLVAAPASAHPSFNPNTVTPGERHTLDLVVPHGCTPAGGAPAEGEATSPTIALSVQVPAGIVYIAPHEQVGWSLTTSATAFTWADDGGSSTDPLTFTLDVELASDVQPPVYFSVAQDCAEGSVLWNDVTADDGPNPPAILLVGDAVGTAEIEHSEDDAVTADEHEAATADEHDDDAVGGTDDEMPAGEDHALEPAAAATPLDGGLVILVVLMLVGGITGILKMD